MRFMILGAGSGLPHIDYHHSSIMVQTTEHNILVDCGEGTAKQLLRHGFNNNFLDAIFISHYHPDHVAGMFMLLQMLYLEGRTKPLKLFLPERPAAFIDTLHLFYTFEQRFKYALEVYEVREIQSFYPYVSHVLTDHLVGYEKYVKSNQYPNQMQSFCFCFADNGKNLVYTSDLTTLANLQPMFDKADVLIIDALHPKVELIAPLKDSRIGQIILTHGISKALDTWLQDNPSERFELARESVYYQVQGD